MTVHFGHFDVADNAGDMRCDIGAVLELGYVVPSVLAVSEGNYIMEAYIVKGFGYHLVEEFGVVRNDYPLVSDFFIGAESAFDALKVKTDVLVESCNDLFKVEDNDYPVVYLGNACRKSYSVAARTVGNGGRIGDLRP